MNNPNQRRSEYYRVGRYAYHRYMVYNLETGERFEGCDSGTDASWRHSKLPVITEEELKIFRKRKEEKEKEALLAPQRKVTLVEGPVVEIVRKKS